MIYMHRCGTNAEPADIIESNFAGNDVIWGLVVTAALMGLVAGWIGRAVVSASLALAAGVALTGGMIVHQGDDFDVALGVLCFWFVLPLTFWLGRRMRRSADYH